MQTAALDQAIELLEKANADLEPELLPGPAAHRLLARYARVEKLAGYGVAALARKVDDVSGIARATGTSMGKARAVVQTGKVLKDSSELTSALQHGDISLDQATEIAAAEEAAPGSAASLLAVAQEKPLHALRDEARRVKLEAQQTSDLAARQRAARYARTYADSVGMINLHLALEPHVGAPIVARAEAEAARVAQEAKEKDAPEPYERYLADAYARLLSGSGRPRTTRPELVVLVSHEVATRGWGDVRRGEVCKIPGIGPVAPEVARRIAQDAFVNGVICDGKDFRSIKRWSRAIPVEVKVALELGDPPAFDGVKCVDCGNRMGNQFDHVKPRAQRGPTSKENLKPRCWTCHRAKTERDRRPGKLRPPDP